MDRVTNKLVFLKGKTSPQVRSCDSCSFCFDCYSCL